MFTALELVPAIIEANLMRSFAGALVITLRSGAPFGLDTKTLSVCVVAVLEERLT